MGNKVSQQRKLQATPINIMQFDPPIQFEVDMDGIDTLDKNSENSTSSSTRQYHLNKSSSDLDSFIPSNNARNRMTSFNSSGQTFDHIHPRNKLKRFQSCVFQESKDLIRKDKKLKRILPSNRTDPIFIALEGCPKSDNYSFSSSLTFPMTNPISSPIVKNTFGAAKINELKSWTGKRDSHIIYSSNSDELSSRELNAKICGKENIMLLVITESGDIFGCYDQTLIPYINTHRTVIKSEEFILFVFDSYGNTALLQKTSLGHCNDNNPLVLFDCSEDFHVFEIDNAFTLETNGYIHVQDDIFENYDLINGTIQYPQQYFTMDLKINHLIALQWI
ncbi:hypothetical protein KM1_319250 [Entamoeba histolytica HM-3:IMSS]|uniref:TLDc domain-containing protein n=4 Tax=Entamoeba histolytica TaxID=5759 RepID=C4LXR9_ENTH1|nr:hypothetical protein EHI_014330 [Entamoeba histolytica HM-1:IMSS]EAL49695.1 hypothetical protein EHI_014330 [Entamoeba histolytica HM-1:IMSS]EMD49788.1 Hypothetical protein EHI5A_272380 [Entamoeba histolytica KU27]EMS11129.1 hypothetical protein KM1_319250 [Entamoeba histolytica HM-3:IMSS]GAT93563.1 hypothetical protein CL6EHI_014330 [Entamoeba histolytica]|eukprot:XP_655081.1 hypothetical protein EHI_014330 [Entamoeba histolytica HM-1:IMSS]